MPDLRAILRTFAPAHAVRNTRREVQEHTHLHEQIDALQRRLPLRDLPPQRKVS